MNPLKSRRSRASRLASAHRSEISASRLICFSSTSAFAAMKKTLPPSRQKVKCIHCGTEGQRVYIENAHLVTCKKVPSRSGRSFFPSSKAPSPSPDPPESSPGAGARSASAPPTTPIHACHATAPSAFAPVAAPGASWRTVGARYDMDYRRKAVRRWSGRMHMFMCM
jgi:hypothetical protein